MTDHSISGPGGTVPENTTSAPQPIEWHGGHSIRVRVNDGALVATVACPHEDTDWQAVPFTDRPNCRQPYLEDGEPDMAESALRLAAGECAAALYTEEEMVGEEDSLLAEIPVEYSWLTDAIEFRAAVTA